MIYGIKKPLKTKLISCYCEKCRKEMFCVKEEAIKLCDMCWRRWRIYKGDDTWLY